MNHKLKLIGALLVSGAFAGAAWASELAPAPIFSDHMVLQREMPVPVWGKADAGAEVTVAFAGQTKTAKADADGQWKLKLAAMKASAEPRDMTIAVAGTDKKLTLSDVLVGEVWLGSGQSNMDMPVTEFVTSSKANRGHIDERLKELAAAAHPLVRLKQRKTAWQVSVPETNLEFSAQLLPFGVFLSEHLKVPVGLIEAAQGATPSGAWLTREMIDGDAALAAYLANHPQPKGKVLEANELGKWYGVHVAPVIPYAIRAILWDQGESGTKLACKDQVVVMGALIAGWRRAWGQEALPFLYVQKPSGGGCAWDPTNPVNEGAYEFSTFVPSAEKWQARDPENPSEREQFVNIRRHPATYVVTTSDLVEGGHPWNKWGYAQRAFQVARGAVYHEDVAIIGPTYAGHKIEGDKVRVVFDNVGPGLAFRHGDRLQGFAVAGADKVWHAAEATIDCNTVIVRSSKTPAPVAVCYAWSGRMAWANLFSKNGLPAISFRTDVQP